MSALPEVDQFAVTLDGWVPGSLLNQVLFPVFGALLQIGIFSTGMKITGRWSVGDHEQLHDLHYDER